MSRYIDANRLEDELYHEAFETDTEMQRWDSGCWIRYKMFEKILEKQPNADVVEVKKGRWDVDEDNLPICSECGEIALQRVFIKIPHLIQDVRMVRSNYCPNCGADMRGGNNEQIH